MTAEPTASRVPLWPLEAGEKRPSWGTVGLSTPQYGAHETQLQSLDERSKWAAFFMLWYNTSALILFGPSNLQLTWDNSKNRAWMWVVAYITSMHVLQVELLGSIWVKVRPDLMSLLKNTCGCAAGSVCRLVWNGFYSRFWSSRRTPTHWLITGDRERKDPGSAANRLNTWQVEGKE